MDLTPNDDQSAFVTATTDWCRDTMPLEGARDRPANLWDQLEAMGLPRITAPEANGGLGLDHATEALVFAELGRFLAPVGLLSSAVANRWFAEPFDGKVALALTAEEPGPLRVLDPADSAAVLMVQPGSVRVFDIPDSFTNQQTGERHVTEHRLSLDPSTDQAWQEWTTTAVWTEGDPRPPLHLQLLAAAYAVGCADAARDMAVDYAKVREQFERPIGSFQAIKHMCADMAVRAAVARSQLYYAACALDAEDAGMTFHVAAAKRLADQAALDNGRANIQIHGGIGMTDEAYPHFCLKRAHLLQFVAPANGAALLAA
ncbi:MAG TPA: acyl-CoA dehydrogenase [Sphingopyxis sp.]|nr:acyl-CoA dehydrogenase [Sphingopyxis sp.]HMP46510.1 acyl-CoA dehydrogenase [Sphingopyxis sp.]HMQ18780.1 acyl-CoA dehydrogenase [Sphingopyxis sp.]